MTTRFAQRAFGRLLTSALLVVTTSCDIRSEETAETAAASASPQNVTESEALEQGRPPPQATSTAKEGSERLLLEMERAARGGSHKKSKGGTPAATATAVAEQSAPSSSSGSDSVTALRPDLAEPMPASATAAAAPRTRKAPSSGKMKAAARRAREEAIARLRAEARARRSDDRRLPLVPRPNNEEPFAELRVLEDTSVPGMTFYDYGVNPTISTEEENASTFAVDVDSAAYGIVRSYLQKGSMPEQAAVRVEEMINAFDYAYAAPDKEAFLVQAEAFPSPNRKGYHVLHIGVKGRELPIDERKPAALVFVIDVSGSMEGESRLGLVKRSLTMLTRQLDGRDSVAIVLYGSDARTVLEPTRTTEEGKHRVIDSIASLSTEGSTNVEAGLELGYDIAARSTGAHTTTRIILCSDGVANTGATSAEGILSRVKEQAARGVTISTIGFGMGNYNDVLMEQLADKGNGNYAYVDNIEAAQRVFVEQLGATLEVIAKDVKIQVEFDKAKVARYRLLGFENRMLDKRDFDNDRADAGEIGAGHTVTAIYEVKLRSDSSSGDLGTLRIRYKEPTGDRSQLLEKKVPVSIVRASFKDASAPTKLSVVVAAFAEKLRGSYWARNESYEDILALWEQIPESLRSRQDVGELRSLIVSASSLDTRGDRFAALLPVAKMDFDRVPVLY